MKGIILAVLVLIGLILFYSPSKAECYVEQRNECEPERSECSDCCRCR